MQRFNSVRINIHTSKIPAANPNSTILPDTSRNQTQAVLVIELNPNKEAEHLIWNVIIFVRKLLLAQVGLRGIFTFALCQPVGEMPGNPFENIMIRLASWALVGI